jgi:small subunit ribosomal protein S21
LEITVNGRDVEKAIRELKRKIQRDGIFRELKNRRFYEKPSLKKKRKQREARKRRAKALRMSRSNNR